MKTWLLDPAILHVLDFGDCLNLDTTFFRLVSTYKRTLTKNEKSLASVRIKENILREIVSAGMEKAFNPVDSIQKAKEQCGLAKPQFKQVKLDVSILDLFIQGTLNTLTTQASLKITAGKPFMKVEALPNVEIAGVISFNNAQLPGSIALCFSKQVFLMIYESMVGEKHTEITQETQDAAAEILNIIYGYAKTKLLERDIRIDKAIPVVLVGEKLKMQVGEKGKSMVLPFESSAGKFHIEIAIG